MRRRDFVKLGTGAAFAFASACDRASDLTSNVLPIKTTPWGQPAAHQQEAMLPSNRVPEGVLEWMLLGGLNPWDTFYVVPEFGNPNGGSAYAGQQWWTYQNDGFTTVPDMFSKCGGGPRTLFEPWLLDTAGVRLNLGPFVWPLRDRPDILKRTRVLVMRHAVEPHEAAIPLALTGHPSGTRHMASLGAHIARYWRTKEPAGRTAPWSYVLYQGRTSVDENLDAALAVGLHDAGTRPLAVRLGGGLDLTEQLERQALGSHANTYDALQAHYLKRLRARLRHRSGVVGRANVLDDYEAAHYGVRAAPELTSLLSKANLTALNASICGESERADLPGACMRLAVQMLRREVQPARHVSVMDAGLDPYSGLGYDTHDNHVERSSNVVHFFKTLADNINEPGEDDPNKLDLDRHLVSINTEFGRAPTPERSLQFPTGTGLDHWPFGYVTLLIGGPVDEERNQVVGAISEASLATDYITPAEHRAALLLASGIWPFEAESFRVGDIRDVTTDLEAALWLRERVLGYS